MGKMSDFPFSCCSHFVLSLFRLNSVLFCLYEGVIPGFNWRKSKSEVFYLYFLTWKLYPEFVTYRKYERNLCVLTLFFRRSSRISLSFDIVIVLVVRVVTRQYCTRASSDPSMLSLEHFRYLYKILTFDVIRFSWLDEVFNRFPGTVFALFRLRLMTQSLC